MTPDQQGPLDRSPQVQPRGCRDWENLTPAEAGISVLVVRKMTNQQIADQQTVLLQMAVKAAARQATRVFLDAESRERPLPAADTGGGAA